MTERIPMNLVRISRGCAGTAAAQPPFTWTPDRWQARLGPLAGISARAVRDGLLSRADVMRLARDTTRGNAPPRAFLIAAMIWGFGDRGYGPWRTARMLATPNAEERVADVLRTARSKGALPAYELLAGPCRLDRMGPVFATKLLYFAGNRSRAPGPVPVVLDRLIGELLDAEGVALRWDRFDPGDYVRYLELVGAIAQEVGATPDDVECALFEAAERRTTAERRRAGAADPLPQVDSFAEHWAG